MLTKRSPIYVASDRHRSYPGAIRLEFGPAATKDVGEDSASAVIYRVPEPARCFLVAYETPHFIDFGFVHFLNAHCNVVWI
jgi:hypothetical protein